MIGVNELAADTEHTDVLKIDNAKVREQQTKTAASAQQP